MPCESYVVGTGEGAHFSTIGEALERAAAGDTIALQAGLYEELLKISEDITITAMPTTSEVEDAETTISGGIVTLGNVTLRGIQIRGHVNIRKGHTIIEECDIHHGNDGIRVGEKCRLTLHSSRVHHCSAGGNGVYFMSESAGEVADCDIYECRVNGVQVDGASVVLRDCRIRDCLFGVYYAKQASGLIANNTLEHIGKFGLYVVGESDPIVRANTVRECGVQCAYVSQKGKGVWSENNFEGSVHFLAGCEAKFGENRVSEKADIEIPLAPNAVPPVATK